jgi:hypothetical protein
MGLFRLRHGPPLCCIWSITLLTSNGGLGTSEGDTVGRDAAIGASVILKLSGDRAARDPLRRSVGSPSGGSLMRPRKISVREGAGISNAGKFALSDARGVQFRTLAVVESIDGGGARTLRSGNLRQCADCGAADAIRVNPRRRLGLKAYAFYDAPFTPARILR